MANCTDRRAVCRATIALIACQTAYPPRGGPSVHVYQVWHRLKRMGYQVLTWGEQAVPGSRSYPRTGAGFLRLLEDADLLYIRFPFESEFTPANMGRLLLRRHMPIVCEFNAPLYEFEREWPPRTFWTLRTKAKVYGRNHLLVRACVDHAICVSAEVGEYARREFGLKNVSVLSNGGDPELFHPGLRAQGRAEMRVTDDDFVIFWGGSTVYYWQGLGQLVQTAARQDMKNVRFVIAGDPTHLPKPLPDNVMTVGQVSYFDIPRLIAGSDVCLCSYRAYDWCPIGFYLSPLKLFDYMSCGRPVVASALGQIKEVISAGENGYLTDGDPEDIAQKIDLLRRDPEKREAMGCAARKTVIEKYNWQNVAERTADIMDALIKRSASRRCFRRGHGA